MQNLKKYWMLAVIGAVLLLVAWFYFDDFLGAWRACAAKMPSK